MSWSKAKKREYNKAYMRRSRAGKSKPRAYSRRSVAGWNNLFVPVKREKP